MQTKCERCGKEFRTFPSRIARGEDRFCSRECSNPARGLPREQNPNWRGGRYRLGSGYIGVGIGSGKYRLEHDLVMEGHLGRSLRSGEHVHHVNGVRDDNRLENLELLSVADHARKHARGCVPSKWGECQCPACGKVFHRLLCVLEQHPRAFCCRACYVAGSGRLPGRGRKTQP
ncbi:MAG: HNH endonuclease [Deltaproteobacteria bacterium]|nr:HNH endonuclease [Deltaproteobacteria bacterium]